MKLLSLAAILLAALVAFAAWHDVSTRVAPTDAAAARQLMLEHGVVLQKPRGFDQQLAMILKVQDAVIGAAPMAGEGEQGIPLGQPREVSNLVHAKVALCFDRSRAIETILRLSGFEVRHLNVYSTAKTHSAVKSLLKGGVDSHSLSEVLTDRGWMLVDSNFRYVGLTDDNRVFGIAALSRNHGLRLDKRFTEPMPPKLRHPFVWVYGLYSRHGRFYPPYDPVPDVNWRELSLNL